MPRDLSVLEQPIWAPVDAVGLGLFVADANGQVTVTLTPPSGLPTGTSLWFHGVSGTTLPLQVAPAVGGFVR